MAFRHGELSQVEGVELALDEGAEAVRDGITREGLRVFELVHPDREDAFRDLDDQHACGGIIYESYLATPVFPSFRLVTRSFRARFGRSRVF